MAIVPMVKLQDTAPETPLNPPALPQIPPDFVLGRIITQYKALAYGLTQDQALQVFYARKPQGANDPFGEAELALVKSLSVPVLPFSEDLIQSAMAQHNLTRDGAIKFLTDYKNAQLAGPTKLNDFFTQIETTNYGGYAKAGSAGGILSSDLSLSGFDLNSPFVLVLAGALILYFVSRN